MQKQEQFEWIQRAKYNERYKRLRTEQLPKYLEKGGTRGSQRVVARARCGNMDEGNKKWRDEDGRKCELCRGQWATLEHWTGECKGVEERMRLEEVLDEEGGERERQSG